MHAWGRFSQENAHHFDEHFVRRFVAPKMGLKEGTPTRVSKVRKDGGKVGTRQKVEPEIRQRLEQRWAEVLAGPTGCASYAELRSNWRYRD